MSATFRSCLAKCSHADAAAQWLSSSRGSLPSACITCRQPSEWIHHHGMARPPHTHRPSAALQDINLRELTKKYGRGIGLNINAVSKYAAQMLIALYHLSTCGVLHAGEAAKQCCSPLHFAASLGERAGARQTEVRRW